MADDRDDRDDLFGDAHAAGRSDDPDRWPANEEGPAGDVAAPKTGKSNVVKILLIVLAVLVLAGILCCGAGFWWARQNVQQTTDPDEVRAMTDEIIAIEIPEDYTPMMGMKMNIFGTGVEMAMYQTPGDGMLQLGSFSGQAFNDPQAQQQLDVQMRQQGAARQVEITETETRTVEIGGDEVEFTFGTGTESQSDAEWREVSGTIPSGGGVVTLKLQQPSSTFDDEQVMQMLESIETP